MELTVQPGTISAEYNFYIDEGEYHFFIKHALEEPDELGFRSVLLSSAMSDPEFREKTPVFHEVGANIMQGFWDNTNNLAFPNERYLLSVDVGAPEHCLGGLYPLIVLIHPPYESANELRNA